MKIICTRPNKDGTYDEVGTRNRFLTTSYTTTNGFLRYGIPSDYHGRRIRLQVWYGGNIYREADKVVFMDV